MKPDILINGTSMLVLGWLREQVNFPSPQSQGGSIVVPGRSSPIRYSKALGRVSYQPRSFDLNFSMFGSRTAFDQRVSEVCNRYAGQLAQIICTEESELYATGTIEVTSSYDPLAGKGTLVLSSTDADAFLYHVEETEVSFTGSGTVILVNDYMPVVPVITTTGETDFSWEAGGESFHKTVNAGIWELPEMELAYGENTISVTGNGVTTFRYREGRL